MVTISFVYKLSRVPRSLELLLAALLLAAGCGNKPDGAQPASVGPSLKRTYTKTELDRLISPGMSFAEVTNTFGPPTSMIQASEHKSVVMYTFPVDLAARVNEPTMIGFDVHLRDGRAINWSPVIRGPDGPPQPSTLQDHKSARLFSLFVARDALRNVLETLDSSGQADMTGMRIEPDLTFSAQVFSDSMDNGPSSDQVALLLSPADALRLKSLTETNYGKRLLIVCSNSVIAAPMITDTLKQGPLLLRVTGSNALDILR